MQFVRSEDKEKEQSFCLSTRLFVYKVGIARGDPSEHWSIKVQTDSDSDGQWLSRVSVWGLSQDLLPDSIKIVNVEDLITFATVLVDASIDHFRRGLKEAKNSLQTNMGLDTVVEFCGKATWYQPSYRMDT